MDGKTTIGLPLPYIHDVPSLRRGSYDYECEWGRFKYEYDLSAYLFTAQWAGSTWLGTL